MDPEINMAAALADINVYHQDGNLKYFSLQYVTRTGRSKIIEKAYKGGTMPGAVKAEGKSRSHFNVKEKGVLMITNANTNNPETPIIDLITHYNGVRVRH